MTGELPRPEPVVSPEARRFWEATGEQRLRLQRCSECAAVVWYPRGICPDCSSSNLDWFEASGRGLVYSFTINHRGTGPYEGIGPYILAYVELEEGPRMLTNIVDCDSEKLRIGQLVEVRFADTGTGTALVRFTPVETVADG
ncbi:MAG: Zn-ribbon domain-containing OB-fold protein [Actinomycetota bacterium]